MALLPPRMRGAFSVSFELKPSLIGCSHDTALDHDHVKRRRMRWTWVECHLVWVPVLVGIFSALSAAAISAKDFLSLRQTFIFSMTACSSGVEP